MLDMLNGFSEWGNVIVVAYFPIRMDVNTGFIF